MYIGFVEQLLNVLYLTEMQCDWNKIVCIDFLSEIPSIWSSNGVRYLESKIGGHNITTSDLCELRGSEYISDEVYFYAEHFCLAI